ncbi:class I SAM-dependent methyltransferase [Thiorhodococcus mannitoliphagus]|uniref:Class I SAM-dependent methyltransferase n=1 Tax=Thiorhodococcus mannitoliphagus TaxID=329406 RepID=A0A6P1DT15_9GAMM|nr:class I SAM-dependent methyltransferase [Thiorhodococcus mannitoliphagus]NEX21258.1 class I SAM-dependent methyltransferase [Thiorhodococcus mannitoliphagus]
MPIARLIRSSALVVALLLVLPLLAVAESPAVGPEMNAYYHGADPQRWESIFERSGREVFDRRFEILQALQIPPGLRIADVGAGTGLFTLRFAEAVGPSGRVYAVDISESFVDSIRRRARAEGLENVVPVVNQQTSVALDPASVDLVFLCDTYHHFEYPDAMLAAIREALAPGGVLAIIDYRREPDISAPWILEHVRADRRTVIKEVSQAGFVLIDEPLELRENFFIRFRKGNP